MSSMLANEAKRTIEAAGIKRSVVVYNRHVYNSTLTIARLQ